MPVLIRELFEAHLTVSDLGRSIAFYRNRLGFDLAFRVDDRRVAFFWLGGHGRSMLGLWETGGAPITIRLHLAFGCTLVDVVAAPERLRAAGIEPTGFYGEAVNEPVVIGWMPAAAVFQRSRRASVGVRRNVARCSSPSFWSRIVFPMERCGSLTAKSIACEASARATGCTG
jgi:catechol 2,3-dioxygenase-like lactoylglutathione lyase family enzyme